METGVSSAFLRKLSETVANSPDKAAVVAGDRSITYRQLADEAAQIAGEVERQANDGPVVIFGDKEAGYVAAILACNARETTVFALDDS